MPVRRIQRLSSNASGDNAAIVLGRDELRAAVIMDQDGELLERPEMWVQFDRGEQVWTIELL